MALALLKNTAKDRVPDVRLVSLFLHYLSEKDEVTESEAAEFRRFQDILDGVCFSEHAWKSDSDFPSPSNKLFLPDKLASQQETPDCPDACCCSAGTEACATWYPVLAFI